MLRKLLVFGSAMAFVLLIAGATVVRAQHQYEHPQQPGQHQEHHAEVEVGKKGEVRFGVETKVGDLILKPGSYRFQHRVANGDHYVQFTELGRMGTKGVAGEVECTIEAASEKFSRTAIFSVLEGSISRVTRIEVDGENVVHVF